MIDYDLQDAQKMGFDTDQLTRDQIRLACMGAENGENDWDAGHRVADSIEQQARLYAESALGW